MCVCLPVKGLTIRCLFHLWTLISGTKKKNNFWSVLQCDNTLKSRFQLLESCPSTCVHFNSWWEHKLTVLSAFWNIYCIQATDVGVQKTTACTNSKNTTLSFDSKTQTWFDMAHVRVFLSVLICSSDLKTLFNVTFESFVAFARFGFTRKCYSSRCDLTLVGNLASSFQTW